MVFQRSERFRSTFHRKMRCDMSKFPNNNFATPLHPRPVAKFIVPERWEIVDSGIGTGQYDNPTPESTLSHQSGTMNFASGCKLIVVVKSFQRKKAHASDNRCLLKTCAEGGGENTNKIEPCVHGKEERNRHMAQNFQN